MTKALDTILGDDHRKDGTKRVAYIFAGFGRILETKTISG
jgi:hypothetical protein